VDPNRSGHAEVSAVIAGYAPRSLGPDVARFAREVTAAAQPHSGARAKAFLFAAGKLGAFGASVGLDLCEALLHPSVIERYIVTDGLALSAPSRRTVRSNLRSLSAAVIGSSCAVPLSRERSKLAYAPGEMAAYFALADAQGTLARRHRARGLLCLGAGAGLMGADLRAVRGTDVVCRSGGVLVVVRGKRTRVVPVLSTYHPRLCASATFAAGGYVIGGRAAHRRTVTTPLVESLAAHSDLPRLDTGRLRATWLVAAVEAIGLKAFMDAAGITCSQRLGDLVAAMTSPSEAEAVTLLGARRGAP
jgi:hypothetical protein